ncbi:Uncharacterised protein [Plesiomonas shigelloides]|uniref:hypothetical protein n=1 Tax=Plesiomonas shigelloides TaxID=703 RepID=UPI000DFAD472|nr:hypothetical protein [Plesiomonas shigelloides]SUB63857.1 Uncharacterised protein [Plesiomonas shigelloides]
MGHIEFLRKLEELNVTFCISVPSRWGDEIYIARAEELSNFISDPIAIYATHYGVSKSVYLAWANDDFSVYCSGKTSKGRPCKKIVTGGSNVSPKRWLELQGEYCSVHQESESL